MKNLQLQQDNFQNNAAFINKVLRTKTGRNMEKILDSADLSELKLLFLCTSFLIHGFQADHLQNTIRNKIKRKKKHIMKTWKSKSLVSKTLESKDLLRLFLKPIKHLLPFILKAFVHDGK